jgi:hypothetical protein
VEVRVDWDIRILGYRGIGGRPTNHVRVPKDRERIEVCDKVVEVQPARVLGRWTIHIRESDTKLPRRSSDSSHAQNGLFGCFAVVLFKTRSFQPLRKVPKAFRARKKRWPHAQHT